MMRLSPKSLLILMPLLSLFSLAGVIEFTDRAAGWAAAGAVTNIDADERGLKGDKVTIKSTEVMLQKDSAT